MRYVLLAYSDEQQWEALPASEREAFDRACRASDEALRESGYLLAAVRLQSSSSATTVRVQHGQVSLTGGPFTRAAEPLVGLFFIYARDLNEAVRVVAQMPQARRGPLEVRPVVERDWLPETGGQDSGGG